ncbi:MAG: 7-cyano-7-deazaguanine synthase QueC [Halobacteria archaeon]
MSSETDMDSKNVVLISGGIDSAVTFAEAHKTGEVTAVHVSYGQLTEEKELECSRRLTEQYGAELVTVPLHEAFSRFTDGLTDRDVDLSVHYDEEGVATSYVPMRNTVFLSVAAGVAEDRNAKHIWYGPNAEDRRGYADCRDEYAEAMAKALSLGTDRIDFELHRPVVGMEKYEIIERGDELGVPFEDTWSCYQEGDEPCGECASCEERRKGFESAGVRDPCT